MRFLTIGLGLWIWGAALSAQPTTDLAPSDVIPAEIPKAKPVEPIGPETTKKVVTSRSKQFRISGGNELGRGLCVILTEDAKKEFLQLLDQRDDWKIPISVMLHGEPGDKEPPVTFLSRHFVVEGVHLLHLHVHLAKGLQVERFKQAVTEMLLCERALRAMPLSNERIHLSVPPWLSVGLREATAWRMQQSDRRLYASMFKQGGGYQVDDLLAVSRDEFLKLDEASRVAFRVSAGSLVMALLEQPQGRQAFRQFLDEAAAFEGEMALLMRRHFPELNLSPNSLSKWWALQLANQGGLNLLTDVMTVVETEEQLARALFLELPELEDAAEANVIRVSLDEWRQLQDLERPARTAAVTPAQIALVHLSYRCFPAYRPLLVEYQKQLIRMTQDEDEAIDGALAELARARKVMTAKSQRGRDYLDWFEITRARETSGVFDDYLRLKQQLREPQNGRQDGMSLYLDQVERLFQRER